MSGNVREIHTLWILELGSSPKVQALLNLVAVCLLIKAERVAGGLSSPWVARARSSQAGGGGSVVSGAASRFPSIWPAADDSGAGTVTTPSPLPPAPSAH